MSEVNASETYHVPDYYVGRQYPFFMGNNGELSDRFYLYGVYSPGVDENFNPYISLMKIAEKSEINQSNQGKDTDLISTILYPRKTSKFTEYLTETMKREDATFVDAATTKEMPYLVISRDNTYLIRSLILGLRNNLRYTKYRLVEGRKIDLLWNADSFVVCTVHENEKEIWLEPGKVYKNTDLTMKNPLDINLTTDDINIRLEKSQPKVMASFLYLIRAFEKQSFDRK